MTDVTSGQGQESAELSAADEQVLREFTERARAGGLQLTGEGGLLGKLTKMVVEGALEGELDDHLGYGKHDPAGRDGGNSRNGHRAKTVLTGAGPVEITVPRDRDSSFEPVIVAKRQRRPDKQRRCCAKIPATCCRRVASERTIRDAWTILCSALTNAVTEELIPKNVASLLHVSKPRKRRLKPWTAEEARQLLESAKRDQDPLYAAYVLILVLGLRKGEVIGLSWSAVNLDRAELDIGWQLQRVGGQLLHRETKTEASEATLPLPAICVTALRFREKDQAVAKAAAGVAWAHSGLVFTTRAGTPFEPRNLNRRFETRCAKAGVRRITVHDMRHTCATLLAALDVHPRVAMRILRHAQIDVTMNVYTEASDAKTLQALKRLGRQLGS